jgi:hypothetical protein
MVRFIHTYPYLMLSLTMLGVFLSALVFTPSRLRWVTLLSGALAAPFALTSPLFVPSYWSPSRLAVALTGIEDVAFTFAGAGLAWMASIWLVRNRISFQPRPERIWGRWVAGACCGFAVGDASWRLAAGPMTATILAFAVLTVVILWRRRELWPLAVTGALGYALFYLAVLKLWYVLVPGFGAQWNTVALWGPMVFGVPLDEVVWAVAFGLAWPLFAAYLFDARLEPVLSSTALEPQFGSRTVVRPPQGTLAPRP